MLMGSERAKQVVRHATKDTERLRILLAGESTTGKTTALQTLPKALQDIGVKAPKIVVMDFDQNADELLINPSFEVFRFGGVPGSDPETYPAAQYFMTHELPKMTDINILVTDSITALSMSVLAMVAKDNGRLGKPPQLQDWNAEMHATQQWCMDMQNIKVSHAIITVCHTFLEKDDLSGRAYNQLVLTGKLPTKLVRLFPEIYYSSKGTAKTPVFTWQTIPDVQTTCRTMMPKFRKPEGIKQDFGPILAEWFAGRGGEKAEKSVV